MSVGDREEIIGETREVWVCGYIDFVGNRGPRLVFAITLLLLVGLICFLPGGLRYPLHR